MVICSQKKMIPTGTRNPTDSDPRLRLNMYTKGTHFGLVSAAILAFGLEARPLP
jgi:hypothetical protein